MLYTNYLELALLFAFREVKGRYKSSLLGPLWVVVYPLLFTFVTTLVFSFFIKVRSQDIPYPLFALMGIMIWNFFSKGIGLGTRSLISNRHLVVETKLITEALPIGYILGQLPDFLINFVFLLIAMVLTKFEIHLLSLLLFIFLFALFIVFMYGLALFLSAFNVLYRDTQNLIDPFLFLIFYMTPIVYSKEYIPDQFSWLLYINPLALFITTLRDLLLLNIFPSAMTCIYMVLFSVSSTLGGAYFFKKKKPLFPDQI